MLFALENAIQTEAKSGRAPTATHTFIRLYRVHKPRLHPPSPTATQSQTAHGRRPTLWSGSRDDTHRGERERAAARRVILLLLLLELAQPADRYTYS